MRAVVQRVKWSKVEIDGISAREIVGEIGPGILTLLGIAPGDTEREVEWMVQKIIKLRVFEDANGKMNEALGSLPGHGHLIVSQFTLLGDASKGNRPSFIGAARPEIAEPLYLRALARSAELGVPTAGGRFGADMKVSLLNDGPVTLVIDSND